MNPLSMAELGILDWIAAHCHNSFWDAVMPFITGLGDQGILWILLGVSPFFSSKKESGQPGRKFWCPCCLVSFSATSC